MTENLREKGDNLSRNEPGEPDSLPQKRFNKAHMARVKAGKCESNLTADFSAILYGLERMVDNSVNIAEETLDSIHFVELEPAQVEALSNRGIPVPVPAQ